jgi:hypothetical protein
MVRKIVLALVILAVAAVPLPALAKDEHDSRDGHERGERNERFEHHEPFGPPAYGVYAPTCSWQGGSWAYQGPVLGADGNYYYVPQWVVPPQYVCY